LDIFYVFALYEVMRWEGGDEEREERRTSILTRYKSRTCRANDIHNLCISILSLALNKFTDTLKSVAGLPKTPSASPPFFPK
jgi:hypothetical protein